MSNVLFVIAMSLGILSLLCSFMAIRGQLKTRQAIEKAKADLDFVRQAGESVASYQDLSSGPRYREYGDLS